MVSVGDGGKTRHMNPYFTPRKPAPRTHAAWIVIGSMICTLCVLGVAAAIWMSQGTPRNTAVSTNPVEQRPNVAPTNAEFAGFP